MPDAKEGVACRETKGFRRSTTQRVFSEWLMMMEQGD
jgi:hypothetical protein